MSSRSSSRIASSKPSTPVETKRVDSPLRGSSERKMSVRHVSFKVPDKRMGSNVSLASKKKSSVVISRKSSPEAEENSKQSKRMEMFREILRRSDSKESQESETSTESTGSSSDLSSNEEKQRRRSRRHSKRRKRRRKKRDDMDLYENNLPAYVIAVANRMKEAAIKRRQDQTKDEMNTIMHRIKMALHHTGDELNESANQNEVSSQEIIVYGMPDLDVEREREKRASRQQTIEFVTSSIKRSKNKIELIQDLQEWFAHLKQVDGVNENDLQKQKERVAEIDAIHKTIISSMSKVKVTSNKLKKIAKQIMTANMMKNAPGKTDQDNEKEGKKDGKTDGKLAVEKKIITTQELGTMKNWKVAAKKIILDLDEVSRSSHQEANRKGLQAITKQFKMLAVAIEHKTKEVTDMEGRLSEKGKELARVLKDSERLQEKVKTNAENMKDLEDENTLLRKKLNELEEKLQNEGSETNRPKARERRRSVFVPTIEGLAKPNSAIADDHKQKAEGKLIDEAVAEQIRARLGAIDGEQNAAKYLDENIAENDNDRRLQMGRRNTLTSGQFQGINDFQKPKKKLQTIIKEDETSEQITNEDMKRKKSKDDASKAVIEALEKSIDSLRNELASSRKTLEGQALKIIELETELTGKETLEHHIEKLELEKYELENELKTSLVAYEKEIEERESNNNNLSDNIDELKNTLLIKEDQIQHLQRCLDTMTSDLQILLDEKLALEQKQVNQVVKIELGDRMTKQQMLIKMKNQYENELQRLRDFLAKEHQRYLAENRKNLTQYQSDIHTIHKGSMQLLKTVNRFKESLAMILERESLKEAAFELRQLENLPVEPSFSSSMETKQMLSMVAYQATELLVSLENRLSKALLSRRLQVKEAATAKGFLIRDLDKQGEKLRRAKETAAIQEEKMKKIEEVNESVANDYNELLSKYKSLQKELTPYQQLIENHMVLKKEFERVQQENKEEVKKSMYQLNEVEKDRAQLKRVVQSQQELISKLNTKKPPSRQRNNNKREQRYAQRTASMFYIAKAAQEKNLKRLDEAFEQDQITSDTHEKAADLIKRTMDLPRLRFVHLVERYVAYNKMIMIKQVMKAAVAKYKNNLRLSSYVKEMEERIEEKSKKWEDKKAELVQYRATLLLQMMETISSVKQETGLLLVEPACKSTTKKALVSSKEGVKFWPKHEKQTLTPLKDSIVGKPLRPQVDETCTMWQLPDLSEEGENEKITMPRIVDLDVNRWKYTAVSCLTGDLKGGSRHAISKKKMEKIKMAFSSKLTLPPIASIYPEKPSKPEWLLEDDGRK